MLGSLVDASASDFVPSALTQRHSRHGQDSAHGNSRPAAPWCGGCFQGSSCLEFHVTSEVNVNVPHYTVTSWSACVALIMRSPTLYR